MASDSLGDLVFVQTAVIMAQGRSAINATMKGIVVCSAGLRQSDLGRPRRLFVCSDRLSWLGNNNHVDAIQQVGEAKRYPCVIVDDSHIFAGLRELSGMECKHPSCSTAYMASREIAFEPAVSVVGPPPCQ